MTRGHFSCAHGGIDSKTCRSNPLLYEETCKSLLKQETIITCVKVKDSEFKSQLTPVHHDSLTIAYSTEEGAPKVVQFNHN
jgi:hypothetical protein